MKIKIIFEKKKCLMFIKKYNTCDDSIKKHFDSKISLKIFFRKHLHSHNGEDLDLY